MTTIPQNVPSYTKVTLDIETRAPWLPDETKRRLADFKRPKALKKPESIEKWNDAFVEGSEAYSRLALDPLFADIISIAVKLDYGDVVCWVDNPDDDDCPIDYFARWLAPIVTTNPFLLIGHNVIGFDAPILWEHLNRYGHNAMANILRPRGRYKSKQFYDTMLEYPGDKFLSLKALALAHGWDTIDGFGGADVAAAWDEGRYDDISRYNSLDVELTWKLYKYLELG